MQRLFGRTGLAAHGFPMQVALSPGLAALLLLAACSSASDAAPSAAPPPVRTTVGALLSNYESNKLAADQRFQYSENGGRVVEASGGVVLDVENDYAEIGESRRSFAFGQSIR